MTSINLPKPPPAPEWATNAPGRKQEFKVHKSKQNAYLAVSTRMPYGDITLYHWNGEGWDVIINYAVPDDCSRCGGKAYFDYVGYRGEVAKERVLRLEVRRWLSTGS